MVAACTVALNLTVPVELFPPVTALGLNVTDETVTVEGVGVRVGVGSGGGVRVGVGVGGAGAPEEFIKTFSAGLAPRTCRAMSALPSLLKSPEAITPPPMLDWGGGTR